MKKLFVLLAFTAIVFVGMQAQNINPGTAALTSTHVQIEAEEADFTGYVADLNGLVMGGDGKISVADAEKNYAKGKPLVLVMKGKIYFVYSTGGAYAGKKLAQLADGDIGILGKKKIVNGLNVIYAAKIFKVS